MDKEIDLQLVLERFPPGDRWVPKGKDTPIFSSLTEGIEWVFQNSQARDYLVKAAEGKVYVYNQLILSFSNSDQILRLFQLLFDYALQL